MKKILFLFFVVALSSCKKETSIVEETIPNKVYIRIETITVDGKLQYSPIYPVNMKN